MKKRIGIHSLVARLKGNCGEFSVKQIAGTVAVVVIIGFIVQFMTGGWLTARVEDVWNWLWEDVIQSWLS
ncbi:hypothetical protein [Acetivibrio cellulolyticus]|uniref:hypothetical protein n=1 Tax=Acetivibrio cellulolyticus TaxID=35830 RepID=UPI0001E2C1BE|nr:hypothetical protein [Acetivibrio cellulolyticus]